MRIKLIANPTSGGNARPRLSLAEKSLKALGAEVELYLTSARGDAREAAYKAIEEGFDRVIAAGGDGTLNEVVNGVVTSSLPVAFLPLGTVNVFALETGIPFDVESACRIAVSGTPRKITLGRIDEDYFLLMASAGWDAEAVAAVRPNVKRRTGRFAYFLSAVEAFLLKPPKQLRLNLPDGSSYGCHGVILSNCRYYGGRHVVSPKASLFSQHLEACLLCQGGRTAQLRFALSLLLKRPLKEPMVKFMSLNKVMLAGEQAAIQVDGDDWGQLPVTVEAVPEAVTVIVPAGFER